MRRLLKKWLPDPETIKNHPGLSWLGRLLQRERLWYLNRRSVATAVAIGLFINFLPIPFQMLTAALLAYFLQANLPIAVVITFINNPFTFIPINFMIYQVGAWIIGETGKPPTHLPTFDWRWENLPSFWNEFFQWFFSLGKAYLIGLPVVAIGSAIIGYALVQWGWRLGIYWQRRGKRQRHSN